MNSTLYDQTLEFISTLRDNSTVGEQGYPKILLMLCDLILHENPDKIHTTIENTKKIKQQCNSCGTQLETWENEICGPCKVDDPRFTDDISD
ncbi:MAG: hypothetical protein ACRBB2_05180 [Nitrosopumilus sp.]